MTRPFASREEVEALPKGEAIALPEWPGDAPAAVSITFDFDAESGARWRGAEDRLSWLSDDRFGAVRGLPRILELLEKLGVEATFYVPGETAVRWPDEVKAIAAAGHEVAHHGHAHLFSDQVEPDVQAEEIRRGRAALCDLGIEPVGYRSPGWELTTATVAELAENGFVYDSSCMGDDRPYFERHGEHRILELPVHWSLDDWPYFGYTRDHGGQLADPRSALAIWIEEFESARAERRHVTYTFHPEVSGRGYRARALERLLDHIAAAGAWFTRQADIAELILGR